MTILEFFSQQFQFQIPQLVAIYIKSDEKYYDLNFFYVNSSQSKWEITHRRLFDEEFFQKLYQQYGVSRNSFIAELDKIEPVGANKKYCPIEVPNTDTCKHIQYVLINNLEQYLKARIFK
jgi:hypothetical protein